MKIFSYLDERLIFLLDAPSKEEALDTLVSKTISILQLPEGERFHQAILDREKIVSTGIGMGVAIPHAKLNSYNNFFITLGILNKGVDWNALDNAPVRFVFLIGGPADRQTEYLKILSTLTVALRDEELRKQLISSTSAQEVLKFFEEL
jgi:nitrogen PTS system EIIA component